MADPRLDKELEKYRNLLDTPTEFEDGFGWTTVAGILFCGLIMLPGSIYLSLMTGGGIGAANWVTLILFGEVARRSMKTMTKGQLVVLLHAAGAVMGGGPFGQFVFRAYMVTSDAARDLGMRDAFPDWYCPKPDSPAITERMLWHPDWLVPIGLAILMTAIGLIKRYTLGYFFFRLCSDVEALPFPMAPISAQGALALAESDKSSDELDKEEQVDAEGHKVYSKWRVFTLGTVIGIAFGMVQVGIPVITGLLLDKPVFLLPQPFLDTTTLTESILPATPTGMVIDIGIILVGFVLPFWAIIGTFTAIVITLIANPVLQSTGVLAQWQPGMDTINTTFVNSVDFWMSFGMGIGGGIAIVSIFSAIRDVMRTLRKQKDGEKRSARQEVASLWQTPNIGRGDFPVWLALGLYVVVGAVMVLLCNHLVPGVLPFLVVFVFLYNPFISYVNARLLGLTGQSVDIPFVREGAFILSGCKTLDIWVAPIPIENFGGLAQSYRVNELTGVNFRSLMKADLVATPIMFILSFFFWAFIWASGSVPSDYYPAAQKNWDLQVKNATLVYSATFMPKGEDSATHSFFDTEYSKALHPKVIAFSACSTLILFTVLSLVGLPTMMVYGLIRGFGALPHTMALEIVGACLGRFYFQKKFGAKNFLQMAPALLAGYSTGVGLIGMTTVAMTLIRNAVSSAPF